MSDETSSSWKFLAFLLGAALLAGCGAPAPLPRLLPPGERVPVVLVPGITGSFLADATSGEILWGRGVNLLSPHDHGNNLARPLGEQPAASSLREAGVIGRMRLFRLIEKPIYGPVADLLELNGYRRGEVAAPSAKGDVYLFGYDWRQDNLQSAARLAAFLERVAAARGGREVDLICQSNGAHLCRWVMKFGGASLEQAEAGAAAAAKGYAVRRLVLVGSSNGGSLRILRELDRGRSYVPVVGRRLEPEVLFTMPSVYQDLPAYHHRPFLDANGQPLELDLYDAEVWRRHRFSIFADASRQRADRHPEIYGDEAARFAFLQRSLDRARRFHAQLARDLPLGATRIFSIQNTYQETPHAAVLRFPPGQGQGGRAEMIFTGDPELERDHYLKALAAAPGDGHATVESQEFLSPGEKAALAAPPYFVAGEHFELILDPGSLHRMLDFLSLP